MEISLIEEEAKIEIMRGHKNLKYKVKHNGKNINLVPRYIQWLNLMKAERGENGIITYCAKCYTFLYLIIYIKRVHLIIHAVVLFAMLIFANIVVSFIWILQFVV